MIRLDIGDHADQTISAIMDGRRVTIRLRYNVTIDRWSMDLSIDDEPVLHGRRVVTGVDMLEQFGFGIGVMFAAAVKPFAEPDRANLPNGNVRIFHIAEDELAAVLAA